MPERNQISKVIAKAWKDPAFKKKLLSDPKAALKEMGIEIPEGVVVRVVEDNSKSFTLVLPQVPTAVEEISDRDLEKLVGGNQIIVQGSEYEMSTGVTTPCAGGIQPTASQ